MWYRHVNCLYRISKFLTSPVCGRYESLAWLADIRVFSGWRWYELLILTLHWLHHPSTRIRLGCWHWEAFSVSKWTARISIISKFCCSGQIFVGKYPVEGEYRIGSIILPCGTPNRIAQNVVRTPLHLTWKNLPVKLNDGVHWIVNAFLNLISRQGWRTLSIPGYVEEGNGTVRRWLKAISDSICESVYLIDRGEVKPKAKVMVRNESAEIQNWFDAKKEWFPNITDRV